MSYLTPMVWLGFTKRKIEVSDLPPILENEEAEYIRDTIIPVSLNDQTRLASGNEQVTFQYIDPKVSGLKGTWNLTKELLRCFRS